MNLVKKLLSLIAIVYLAAFGIVGCAQRQLLFHPSHDHDPNIAQARGLTRWQQAEHYLGYARIPQKIERVWLVLHGNAGQAAHRSYVLKHFKPTDAVYIMEYPGYGERLGAPSQKSMNQAAQEAYMALAQQYGEPINVFGESIGTGPASYLATLSAPPKRIVLVVPFDVISKVAQETIPFLPAKLYMLDQWNNIESLQHYTGRLDIWGATYDQVIPVHHARALAQAIKGANYHEFNGTHHWSHSQNDDGVKIDE